MTARPAKPEPLQPQWQDIPEALRKIPAWVSWRYEWRDDGRGGGKWTKPPRRAVGDDYAATNKPETWADFDAARAAAARADGIGLILTDDLVGIDLDHVLGADGGIEPWAAEVIDRFQSCYIERSPGGDGMRIFCRGAAVRCGKGGPENRCEVYDKSSPRYLTVTGHRYNEGTVSPAQPALDWLHERHFTRPQSFPSDAATPTACTLTDEQVLKRAREAKNGAKFAELFAGVGGDDDSINDAALVGMLVFYTRDDAQIDRLFRRSGLMRSKWDEKRGDSTYGALTISNMLGKSTGQQVQQVPRQSGSPAQNWQPLDPLPEPKNVEPEAFPFDALGPILGPAAHAIADGVQAPDALAAGSVLAAAAVAAQPIADILHPRDGRKPLSLFIVTAASSGDRKSATDAVACAPIEEQRREDGRKLADALQRWNAERRDSRPADQAGGQPIAKSIIVSKGTTEGLHLLLRTQSAVGMFTTEGAELIGGHSMREDRRSAAIAWMCKGWGGETLDSMTKNDGLSVLFGRRVSMHVLLQPILLQSLLADPLAQGQGWLARCLVAAPLSLAGTRLYREDATPVAERGDVVAFHRRIRELVAAPAPIRAEGDGFELAPRGIGLSAEALALWIEFYNEVERQQAPGGDLAGVTAWASKAAEHAMRIAGNVMVIGDDHAAEVSGEAMFGGIQVATFYLNEHVRLLGQSQERLHVTRLRTLLTWMQQCGPTVRHSSLLQNVTRSVRELRAEGIGKLLDELAQRGYIRRAGDKWEVRP